MSNATENKLPLSTSGYDRKACKTCACSTCYGQGFCDAVPAGICLVNWTGAMPMKEHITINLNTVPQSCRIWAALFYITDRTVVSGIMLDEYDVIFYWRRYT